MRSRRKSALFLGGRQSGMGLLVRRKLTMETDMLLMAVSTPFADHVPHQRELLVESMFIAQLKHF